MIKGAGAPFSQCLVLSAEEGVADCDTVGIEAVQFWITAAGVLKGVAERADTGFADNLSRCARRLHFGSGQRAYPRRLVCCGATNIVVSLAIVKIVGVGARCGASKNTCLPTHIANLADAVVSAAYSGRSCYTNKATNNTSVCAHSADGVAVAYLYYTTVVSHQPAYATNWGTSVCSVYISVGVAVPHAMGTIAISSDKSTDTNKACTAR